MGVKQLPGYGLKTLIRPGMPGHLGPRRGPEGEGAILPFSHWEKVAEGRMRAARPGDYVLKSGNYFWLFPKPPASPPRSALRTGVVRQGTKGYRWAKQ